MTSTVTFRHNHIYGLDVNWLVINISFKILHLFGRLDNVIKVVRRNLKKLFSFGIKKLAYTVRFHYLIPYFLS